MDAQTRLAPLGRALFGAGILLIVLRGLELFTRMPGLPVFWYANQPLWIVVGVGLVTLGWRILWGESTTVSVGWHPVIPGKRFHSVTLYVNDGCHLCEEAAAVLNQYETWIPAATEISIQSNPGLFERFRTCVPVALFDGKIRFRGRINETLLRRLIDGTPPLPPQAFGTGYDRDEFSE